MWQLANNKGIKVIFSFDSRITYRVGYELTRLGRLVRLPQVEAPEQVPQPLRILLLIRLII